MIAFLGMGLLGSGFVRALRRRGEEVCVWNRTAERAERLADTGARVAQTPADAARGAARVHLTLSDDAAVDDVLEQATAGLGAGAFVVDHSTVTSTGVAARVARWEERGVTLLHAPVFMGPQNALDGTGLMLTSGEPARIAKVREALAAMTGKLVELGDAPGAAAAFKLLGNMHLMFLTAGLADMFALGKALGLPAERAATLFSHFNPGATIGARVGRMLQQPWDEPSWELGMARKDARLMEEEAARAGVKLEVLPAIAARMDAVIAEGHGGSDWTVLAKDALGGGKTEP
jgi:3-hydroxyisobutyrate dehydrogenase